jgi:hypothetical protein
VLPSVVAGIGLCGCLLAGTAFCRPSWYTPSSVDFSRLESDKRSLLTIVDAIGEGLNGRQVVDLVLDEAQLNRWIAARQQIWPGADFLPPGLERPQIMLLDAGCVHVATLVHVGAVRLVLTLRLRLDQRDSDLDVEIQEARLGLLPLPARWAARWLPDTVLPRNVGRSPSGGVSVPNRWIWQNGKRPFRIDALMISRARLSVRIAPLEG